MLATPELIRETAQFSRLEKLLPRWRRVPMYQNPLAQLAKASTVTGGLVDFFRLPLISKREMRKDFPQNFLPPGQTLEALLEQNRVELEYTSGTSEERLPVLFGRGWWNEQEERVLRLNRLVARVLDEHPGARRATLVPPVCNGLTCFAHLHSRAERTVGATLYVNRSRIPFLLSDAELAQMAAEISEWSPQFLDLDPVHGSRFALYCEGQGIRFPSLKFILCSYEFVSVVHRRILQRVFGVPVFDLYGSTETGHLLMENECGEMKPSLETAFLENVESDERGIGHLVVTTLTNDYMPLVRYRIGDLVERQEQPYGTNYFVHGRSRDALYRRDGRRVTTLEVDQCFAGVGGILHYLLQQSVDGGCRLQFVSDGSGPGAEELKNTRSQLEDLLQSANPIVAESVKMLPPTLSGKFRLTQRTD
jgi:phenylacetate-CoA ligase